MLDVYRLSCLLHRLCIRNGRGHPSAEYHYNGVKSRWLKVLWLDVETPPANRQLYVTVSHVVNSPAVISAYTNCYFKVIILGSCGATSISCTPSMAWYEMDKRGKWSVIGLKCVCVCTCESLMSLSASHKWEKTEPFQTSILLMSTDFSFWLMIGKKKRGRNLMAPKAKDVDP